MIFEMLSRLSYNYDYKKWVPGACCAQEEFPLRGREPAMHTWPYK